MSPALVAFAFGSHRRTPSSHQLVPGYGILSEQYAIELLGIDHSLRRNPGETATKPVPGPFDAVGVVADEAVTLGSRDVSQLPGASTAWSDGATVEVVDHRPGGASCTAVARAEGGDAENH